jgi:hypothetical protein
MKSLIVLSLSLLLSAPGAAMAQSRNDTPTTEEITSATGGTVEISRNPKDMDDTSGMVEATVITWIDRNGVRSYTDDPKKAPSSARPKKIYYMPARQVGGDVQVLEAADSGAEDLPRLTEEEAQD